MCKECTWCENGWCTFCKEWCNRAFGGAGVEITTKREHFKKKKGKTKYKVIQKQSLTVKDSCKWFKQREA